MTSQSRWIWCNAWSQFELRDISDFFSIFFFFYRCVWKKKWLVFVELKGSQGVRLARSDSRQRHWEGCLLVATVTLQLQFTWSPFVRSAQRLRDDVFVLMPKCEAQWDPRNWAKAASLVPRKWWNNTFSYRMMHVRLIKIRKVTTHTIQEALSTLMKQFWGPDFTRFILNASTSKDVKEWCILIPLSQFACRRPHSCYALGVIWQTARLRLWDLTLIVSMTTWKKESENNKRLVAKLGWLRPARDGESLCLEAWLREYLITPACDRCRFSQPNAGDWQRKEPRSYKEHVRSREIGEKKK